MTNTVNGGVKTWRVFGESVRGASHTHKQLPNQDAILWKDDETADLPLVLAISDGHGSERYFRSNLGAQFAVALAVDELTQFARAFSGSVTNIPLFTYLVEQLPKKIVEKWQAKVKDHLDETPFFTRKEWQHYEKGTALPEITHNPLIPYGATLLVAVVTKHFILYLQLGDGDIVQVNESAVVTKPMKVDTRLLANETTSLCSPTAVQDFRVHFDFINEPPTLILLSTDGYANSFSDDSGFLRVGPDILELVRTHGLDWVKKSLPEWLQAATEHGSGDDITVGVLYHTTSLPSSETAPPLPAKDEAVSSDAEHEPKIPATADEQEPAISIASESSIKELTTPVLVVSLQPGEGIYTSIQAALLEAQSHARIEIHPGLYRENLLIDKDVELVGMNEQEPVIIEAASPCLTLQAQHAQLHNLKIQGKPSLFSMLQPPKAVVEITAGSSSLNHCEIVGGTLGLRVRGEMTAPTIQSCHIHDHSRTGLVFTENALGLVVESRIATNQRQNIVISEGSNPLIQRCVIQNGSGVGIHISQGAAGRIEGCEIIDHQGVGLLITQGANPVILGCQQIARNQGGGLLFTKHGGGKVIECEIAANKISNIHIQGLSYPYIQHCRLQDGEGQGILIDGQGKGGGGFIEDCEISGHTAEAILVRNGCYPFIHLCTIHDGQGTGLLLRQKGHATVEKSTIVVDSQRCMEISGKDSYLSMSEVEIQQKQGSEASAIEFSDNSSGQLERCKVNTQSSIGIAMSQHVALSLRLCLIESGSYALQVQEFSTARVEGGTYRSLTHGKKSAATSCDKSSHVMYIQKDPT